MPRFVEDLTGYCHADLPMPDGVINQKLVFYRPI